MADYEGKSDNFYEVLGLNKECTESELKNAYKKLALRWHPDRCSASGNSKFVEESKKKFQDIQQAYSVLSDANKRFLYDVGVYDSDDDERMQGMGDFLNEMADMMSQAKPTGNVEESFEELQQLFDEIFQGDIAGFGLSSQPVNPTTCCTSSYMSYCESSNSSTKRTSSDMNKKEAPSAFEGTLQNFCVGVEHRQEFMKRKGVGGTSGGASNRRRYGRKQKVSSSHNVFTSDHSGSISA